MSLNECRKCLMWPKWSCIKYLCSRVNLKLDLELTFLEVLTFFFLMYFPAKHWPVVLCLNRLTTANWPDPEIHQSDLGRISDRIMSQANEIPKKLPNSFPTSYSSSIAPFLYWNKAACSFCWLYWSNIDVFPPRFPCNRCSNVL